MDDDRDDYYEPDDGATRASDVLDRATGKPRLLAEQCATCIFRPGNPMRLRGGRLRQITSDACRAGSFITCHSTLYDPAVQPAICRGFADRYDTNVLRVFGRLGGFTEVNEPAKDGGHDAT